MLRGLQTHFNEPLNNDSLVSELADKTVQLARIDAQVSDKATTQAMTKEVESEGIGTLVIVRDSAQIKWLNDMAELRNEPDIEGPEPEVYRDLLWEAAEVADEYGVTLCGPAVSGFHKRGLGYLKAIGPLPPNVICSIHDYPEPGGYWSDAKAAEKLRALRDIIGPDRHIIYSEMGAHTAPERFGRRPFSQTVQRTNEEALIYLQEAFIFLTVNGIDAAVVYQLNDGPENVPLHRYGMRDINGKWKIQMRAFRRN